MTDYEVVKTFSATKASDRKKLGDRATEYLRSTELEVVGKEFRQSSDSEFHCQTIVLFLRRPR